MFKKILMFSLCCFSFLSVAKPIVDKDVINIIQAHEDKTAKYISLFVFFKSFAHSAAFVDKLTPVSGIFVKRLNFMPVVIVTFLKHQSVLPLLLRDPYVKHIALNNPAGEKIELQSEATKPKVPFRYPGIDLWWNHGFKGQSGIIGLIDSGIAPDHPSLSGKKIIINKRLNSYYSKYPYGVRSPHGTGVACIYAGYPQDKQKRIRGVAYKTATILSTLAGEGNHHKEDYYLTYSSLNWLLSGFSGKPSIINYSFGNGDVTCPFCSDWSGMAKIVDYIVNQEKILWVTSAGNNGFIKPRTHYPFASTMTVPAESYNALTVANMNMYAEEEYTVARKYMRATHAIRYTSSRGPTLIGRKKPDITAPGNDTFTCAPNPKKYKINYTNDMNYQDGYRLMGGTSSAAPHVGGAVLLLKEAGIANPMAIKALLINSADSWTDNKVPGPNDPQYDYKGGHRPQLGSEWNPTYGWGYMNLESAFYQRHNIFEGAISLKNPSIEYKLRVLTTDKITLVHERRVGFNELGTYWQLSHLKLQMFDAKSHQLLAEDASAIDNVHQISICKAARPKQCINSHPRETIIRVSLVNALIEGSKQEDFALAFSSPKTT